MKKKVDFITDFNEMPELVDVNYLANLFRVTPTTIRNWEKRGDLVPFRLDNVVRYSKQAVMEFIQQNTREATG